MIEPNNEGTKGRGEAFEWEADQRLLDRGAVRLLNPRDLGRHAILPARPGWLPDSPTGTVMPPSDGESPSTVARVRFREREGRPLLLSDWTRAVFLHYEVDSHSLQRYVPFELDLLDGRAWVSLVAFTLGRLRLASGGRAAHLVGRLVGEPRLLNLRTYVHGPDGPGICFLAEWISSALHAAVGPALYGLPYRWAEIGYAHEPALGHWAGNVRERGGRAGYRYESVGRAHGEGARGTNPASLRTCEPGSLDEFLLERYVAYTRPGRRERCFGIWHQPWRLEPLSLRVLDESLLEKAAPWWPAARLIRAHYSPGVRDVWMGRPRFVKRSVLELRGEELAAMPSG
jgi:uncharacterized protein YqjF (DUF2071 family)